MRLGLYPILDRGAWGHDRIWEREVIDRIKRGEAAPQSAVIADNGVTGFTILHGVPVGGSWEHAEEYSKHAIRNNSAYLNDQAIAARAAQRKLMKAQLAEALKANAALVAKAKAERAKAAARKRAEQAERRRGQEAWERGLEERSRQAAERRAREEAEWDKADVDARHAHQRGRILTNMWQCVKCRAPAWAKIEGEGYRVTCSGCGRQATGSHEDMVGMLPK